jgi:hypothetical protein
MHLDAALRRAMVQALILLRNRNQVHGSPLPVVEPQKGTTNSNYL